MARHGKVDVKTVADVKTLVGVAQNVNICQVEITPDDAYEMLKLNVVNRGLVSLPKIKKSFETNGWTNYDGLITFDPELNILSDGQNRLHFISEFADKTAKFGVNIQFNGKLSTTTDTGTRRSTGNQMSIWAKSHPKRYSFGQMACFTDEVYQQIHSAIEISEPKSLTIEEKLDFIEQNLSIVLDIIGAGLCERSKVDGFKRKSVNSSYIYGCLAGNVTIAFVKAFRDKMEDVRLNNKKASYKNKKVDNWNNTNVEEVVSNLVSLDSAGSSAKKVVALLLNVMESVRKGHDFNITAYDIKTAGVPYKIGI